MVTNVATGKSRGYAFIEFERERDMHGKSVKADSCVLITVDADYANLWS